LFSDHSYFKHRLFQLPLAAEKPVPPSLRGATVRPMVLNFLSDVMNLKVLCQV